jgi:hypothetical protein
VYFYAVYFYREGLHVPRHCYHYTIYAQRRLDSVGGVEARYRLTVRGSNSGERKRLFSAPFQTVPVSYPPFLYFGCPGCLSRVKRPERGVYHPPHPAPRLRMSGTIPSLPLCACMTCYDKRVCYPEEFAVGNSAYFV